MSASHRRIVLALLATPALSCTPEPQWFKGNLHTHSLWSDGDQFPEVVLQWYRERGYDFVAMSDHNVLADSERWITIADESRADAERWISMAAAVNPGIRTRWAAITRPRRPHYSIQAHNSPVTYRTV